MALRPGFRSGATSYVLTSTRLARSETEGESKSSVDAVYDAAMGDAIATSKGMESAAAILAGSTFGNTCSPIADNTVLASLATGCDLVLHAKTMVPYTLLTLFVSFCFGTLPVSLGLYGPGVGLLVCIGVVILVLRFFGTDPSARHRVPGAKRQAAPCA